MKLKWNGWIRKNAVHNLLSAVIVFAVFVKNIEKLVFILISSWKNGFISSHNEKNTPQIKELEAQLDRYGIRIVGKVCDNRYRDYAVRDYLKEHPSIKEYVVVDDDIKEYSSKDIPHLRLVDSKVGFR